MLNARLLCFAAILALDLSFVVPGYSAEKEQRIVVPNVGIEYRAAGVVFAQDAEKNEWPPSVTMGGALELEILALGRNRLGFGASYMRFLGEETEGTAQIDVTTVRQQVDLTLLYRYHWTFLSVFAAVGASAGITSAVTRIYNLGELVRLEDEEGFWFSSREPVTEEKAVGTIWGGTLVAGIGLDVGRMITAKGRKLDNFLFWNIAAQYSNRNRRHEPSVWTSVSFYPMALKK